MNALPKCFVIKRDAGNPLWDKYIAWMNREYSVNWNGASIDAYYGNNGDNGYANCSATLTNNPTIITLEQWNEATNEFPEKWYIITTEENNETVCDWFDSLDKNNKTDRTVGNYYTYEHCGWIKDAYPNYTEGLTEVTFEQFKKYVLKETEFVLPKKWKVAPIDAKSYDMLTEWSNTEAIYGWDNTLLHSDRYWIDRYLIRTDEYIEITLEQFRKYVLKQETMKKKIIKYKLKEGCEKYLPVLDKISSAFSVTRNYYIEVGCIYYDDFKEAQVLDLWFDPIYEGDTPDIEINGYKAKFNGDTVKFGCRIYTKDFIFNLEDALNRGVDLATEKEKIKEMARYFRNNIKP
jgi:hypothetical protein